MDPDPASPATPTATGGVRPNAGSTEHDITDITDIAK
jgi:hypothetical protein